MNKNVFLWGLYGFANTPLTAAIGGLYLAQWVVLDNRVDDIWYGTVFTLSSVLLLATSPFWGAWSDLAGRRKPFLGWMTLILIISGGLLGLIAISSLPQMTRVILVLVLFFFVQYFYQLSLIFYNSLLYKLSTPSTLGKVSGIGDIFDELGWLIGPAILLPFATGKITLFGEPGRSQVFIPAVLLFAILGLPLILWLKESREKISKKIGVKEIYTRTIQGYFDLIWKNKNAALFLIAFMLVSDALLTAQLYFAITLDQVFKIDDIGKFFALACLQIGAIPSAYVIGKLSDKYGTKRLLIFSCLILLSGFIFLSLNFFLPLVYVLATILGVGFAGFYVTSRALLIKISPASRHGEYFGFYSTFQRFASIIGPMAWGLTTLLLKDYGSIKYRIATLVLAILMLAGTLLMTRVREERD